MIKIEVCLQDSLARRVLAVAAKYDLPAEEVVIRLTEQGFRARDAIEMVTSTLAEAKRIADVVEARLDAQPKGIKIVKAVK